jgi:hypothetical protein
MLRIWMKIFLIRNTHGSSVTGKSGKILYLLRQTVVKRAFLGKLLKIYQALYRTGTGMYLTSQKYLTKHCFKPAALTGRT